MAGPLGVYVICSLSLNSLLNTKKTAWQSNLKQLYFITLAFRFFECVLPPSLASCYCCGNTFGMLKVIADCGTLIHAPRQKDTFNALVTQ